MTSAAPAVAHGGLASTGVVTLAASVLGAAVNFAIAVVVGRSYGAADTGVFFSVIGVFLVASTVLKLGADTGITRAMSRLRALGRDADLRTTAAVAVLPVAGVGSLAGGALWLAGAAVADRLGVTGGAAGTAAELLRTLAPFVPVLAVTTVLTAGTRGLGRVAPYALLQNVALPATRLAGVAAAAALGLGIVGATRWWAAGLPLVAGLAAGWYAVTLRRATMGADRASARPWRLQAREFWGFSLPRAAAAIVEITLEWLDVLLVALLAGEAAAGVYAVATRLVKVAFIVDQALRVTTSTRISAWLATGDLGRVQALYEVATSAMVTLIWPFVILLSVFSEPVMALFGSDFGRHWPIVVVMGVGAALMAAAGSLQSILLLGGRSAVQLGNKVVSLLACVLLNLALTPPLGALGGALAWTGTVVVDTILVAWAVRRLIGVRLSAGPAARVGPLVLVAVGLTVGAVRVALGPTPAGVIVAGVSALLVLSALVTRTRHFKAVTEQFRLSK